MRVLSSSGGGTGGAKTPDAMLVTVTTTRCRVPSGSVSR
jgi:hypothetical protein